MTAKIGDMFRYQEQEYLLVGIGEGELFGIWALGLTATRRSFGAKRRSTRT